MTEMPRNDWQAPVALERERDVPALLGQVMGLVAIALGMAAFGGYLGKDLDVGTAQILSFVGIGMLFAQAFVGALRQGPFAMGWLFALAVCIGMGVGPFLNEYMTVDPNAVATAAGGTALTVAAMGAFGFATSKDLAGWMKPLSYIMLGLFAISIVALVVSSPLGPVFSLIVYGISALLILVNFNYLKKHGTEADAIFIATGIFISIVNIFLSLLNIFGGR